MILPKPNESKFTRKKKKMGFILKKGKKVDSSLPLKYFSELHIILNLKLVFLSEFIFLNCSIL